MKKARNLGILAFDGESSCQRERARSIAMVRRRDSCVPQTGGFNETGSSFVMRCCNLTKPSTRPSAPSPVNNRYTGQSSLSACARLSVVAALLVAVPCLAEERIGVAAGQTASVSIDNSIFTPSEVTVTPGTTVTWTNNDAMPHTVVDVKKMRSARKSYPRM